MTDSFFILLKQLVKNGYPLCSRICLRSVTASHCFGFIIWRTAWFYGVYIAFNGVILSFPAISCRVKDWFRQTCLQLFPFPKYWVSQCISMCEWMTEKRHSLKSIFVLLPHFCICTLSSKPGQWYLTVWESHDSNYNILLYCWCLILILALCYVATWQL